MEMQAVVILLVALLPVLFIGTLLADLLLANAPRRGKRPDVATVVEATPLAADSPRVNWWLAWCGYFLVPAAWTMCFWALLPRAGAGELPSLTTFLVLATFITGMAWWGRRQGAKRFPVTSSEATAAVPRRRAMHPLTVWLAAFNVTVAFGSIVRATSATPPTLTTLIFCALTVPTITLVARYLIHCAFAPDVSSVPSPQPAHV
jgi:hypothetical protein